MLAAEQTNLGCFWNLQSPGPSGGLGCARLGVTAMMPLGNCIFER